MNSRIVGTAFAIGFVTILVFGCGTSPAGIDAFVHDVVAVADVVADTPANDVAFDIPIEDIALEVPHADVVEDVSVKDVTDDSLSDTFIPDPPDVPPNPECTNPDAMVTVSGHVVQAVAGAGQDLTGGVVSVVGHPEYSVTLGRSWAYSLQAPSCTEIILELDHPGLARVHTGILYTGDEGLDEVTLQTPDHETFDLLLWFSQVDIVPGKCQMATTITDLAHLTDTPCHACGEPGALAFLSPHVPAANGPIYFQIEDNGIIYPYPPLIATSEDGGLLFVNLEPGDYLVYGYKEGFEMTAARFRCQADWFVNPAPPRGIQVVSVQD